MRDDYGPFFAFVRTSGMRLKECVTQRWAEVDFGRPSDRHPAA
jgi:hypothetical protein